MSCSEPILKKLNAEHLCDLLAAVWCAKCGAIRLQSGKLRGTERSGYITEKPSLKYNWITPSTN